MKVTNRIMFNVLLLTVGFSAFAGSNFAGDVLALGVKALDHKKEIGTHTASFAAGALLVYLATNKRVKAYVNKKTTAVSDYTKAKYNAMINYWKNLSTSKKVAVGAVTGAAAASAYLYFDLPGAQKIKEKAQEYTKSSSVKSNGGTQPKTK